MNQRRLLHFVANVNRPVHGVVAYDRSPQVRTEIDLRLVIAKFTPAYHDRASQRGDAGVPFPSFLTRHGPIRRPFIEAAVRKRNHADIVSSIRAHRSVGPQKAQLLKRTVPRLRSPTRTITERGIEQGVPTEADKMLQVQHPRHRHRVTEFGIAPEKLP